MSEISNRNDIITGANNKFKMNREEELEREVIDDMLQWPAEKIYNTFGPWLETVVNLQKDRLQLKLKTIWQNRKCYAFRTTGEQIESDTMLLYYFDIKKVKKYSLSEMEKIIDKIENETYKTNPKQS